MAIDNSTETGRIKIQELAIPEPAKREAVKFDPGRDITDEDWKNKIDPRLNKYLNTLNESSYYPGPGEEVLQFFQALAVIAPEKVKHVVTDEHWSKMKEFFNDSPNRALKTAATIRLLDPERAKDEHLVSEEQWESIRSGYFSFAFLVDVIEIGADARLFDPENTDDFRLEGSGKWDRIQETIDAMKDQRKWYQLAELLANIKIVDPQQAKKFEPDKETWESLQALFDLYRGYNDESFDFSFVRLASSMAIIAAEDVKITREGLELKMPTPNSDLNPKEEMPERRRF